MTIHFPQKNRQHHDLQKNEDMRMTGTVIAWHTPDEKYTALANDLASQLASVGQNYKLYTFEKLPGEKWQSVITRVKTTLWRQALDDCGGPLLFLDADCNINGSFDGLWPAMNGADIGLAFHTKQRGWPKGVNRFISTRAFYVADTEAARRFMSRWARMSEPDNNEEGTLLRLFWAMDHDATFKRIPDAYCGFEFTRAPSGAVITHTTAHQEDQHSLKLAELRLRRLYRSIIPKWKP